MWTLITLLAVLPARANEAGVWVDARVGASAIPSAGELQVGAGVWTGSFNRSWSAGEYVAIGASYRVTHGGRQALLGEARWAWEFLGGSNYVGLALGREWTAQARGTQAMGIIGLKWVIFGDYAGPALRAEAGGGDIDGLKPRGTLTFGLEGVIPALSWTR